jgi:hypothetical protein
MNTKKVWRILLVVFLGFWMLHDPQGFAMSAKSLGAGCWDALTQLFQGLIHFFDQRG